MSQHQLPEPHIRDEFRRELRARLMREAAVVLVPQRRGAAWTAWLRPAFVAGLAALVLTIGAGSAAAGSVPGDLTFGLKRAIEEVRVALTFDDVERVRVLADLTDQRLSELERVAAHSDRAPIASEEYALAVTRLRAAVNALQQSAPLDKSDSAQDVADAAREKHEFLLERLKDRLSENAKDSVERAIEEERRDTKNDKDRKRGERDEDDEDDEDERAPRTGASPRQHEQATPRTAERRETPRPTTSPDRD